MLRIVKIEKGDLETVIRCLASLILLLVLSTQAYAENGITFMTPEHGKRVDHRTAWLVVSTNAATEDMAAVLKNKDTVKRIDGEAFEGDEAFVFHALLSLETGLNEVTLGGESFSIFYSPRYGSADKARDKKEAFHNYPPYSFHIPEKEESCSDCHGFDGTCLDCHAELLTAKQIHGPVGAALAGLGGGACVVCHDAQSAPSRFVPKFGGKGELCLGCHEEMKRSQLGRKYFHGPVGVGQCTACHDPHGSPLRYQLPEKGERLCFLCHDEKRFISGKNVHGAVHRKRPGMKSWGCDACHNPHASDHRLHLLADEKELCNIPECHLEVCLITEDHPVRNHPVSGKFGPERSLTCSSCHNPHSSDFPFRLPGSKFSICCDCHEDMGMYVPEKPEVVPHAGPPH